MPSAPPGVVLPSPRSPAFYSTLARMSQKIVDPKWILKQMELKVKRELSGGEGGKGSSPPPPAPSYHRYPDFDKAVADAGLGTEDEQSPFEPGVAGTLKQKNEPEMSIAARTQALRKRAALIQLKKLMSSAVASHRTKSDCQFRVVRHEQIKSMIFENDGPDHRIRVMLRTRPPPGQSSKAPAEWKPWRVGLQDAEVFLDVHDDDEGELP